MMRFKFENVEYEVEFRRSFKKRYDGTFTTFPSTTVNLRIVTDDIPPKQWPIYRTATVGLRYGHDFFSVEQGRKQAMKHLKLALPTGMHPLLARAYADRPKGLTHKQALHKIAAIVSDVKPEANLSDQAEKMVLAWANVVAILRSVGIS